MGYGSLFCVLDTGRRSRTGRRPGRRQHGVRGDARARLRFGFVNTSDSRPLPATPP